MKRHIIRNLWLPTAALLVSAGCAESDIQELFPSEYSKILYIKDAGDKNVTLYVTGKDMEYSFRVCKGGSDPGQSAEARVQVMSQEDLNAAYSIPYGKPYRLLTSDAYSIGTQDIDFGPDDKAQTVNVTLKVDRIKDLTASDNESLWTLPIELVSATDSVNAENNRYVLIVNEVSEPLIGFRKTGVEEFTCDISTPFSLKVPVSLTGGVENQWDITADIGIDTDFLTAYNSANGTDYALPDVSYNVSTGVSLPGDRQETSVDISIPDFGHRTSGYMMIPVRITGTSIFSISSAESRYAALLHLVGKKFDRSSWQARACSEQHFEQFDGWSEADSRAQNVLDGDITTIWHYKYGSKGEGTCAGHNAGKHCIMIDTRSRRMFTQIGLVQRAGGEWNILKSVRFWVSDNDAVWNANASEKTGWTPIDGIYTMSPDTDQREHIFDIPATEGRYLKVEVVESLKGGDVGAFAEIYCYGK